MSLKHKVGKLEDVDEKFRGLYKQDGATFVLDLESEDLAKLNEFRDTNTRLTNELKTSKERLDVFAGLDPAAVAEIKAQVERTKADEEKELIRKGKFEEVITRRTAAAGAENERQLKAVQATLEEKDKTIGGLKNRLATLLVDQDVSKAIESAGLKPRQGALADITRRAREVWSVQEDGSLAAFEGGTKNAMYSKVKAGQPITMSEYVLTRLAQEASHLFEGSGGGGASGGAKGGTQPSGVLTNPDPLAFGRNLKSISEGKTKVDISGAG